MKKAILFIAILVLSSITCYAAPLPPQSETQQLLDSIKDLRFNIEAGINYRNYSEKVSKVHVDFKKFIDKYPDNSFQTYAGKIIYAYKDAGDVWQRSIYDQEKFIAPNAIWRSYIAKAYPSVPQKVKDQSTLGWYYEEVMQEIWKQAKVHEDDFKVKITETYKDE